MVNDMLKYPVDEARLSRFRGVKGFPISIRFCVEEGRFTKGGVSYKNVSADLPSDPVHALVYMYEKGVTQGCYDAWKNLSLMSSFNWACTTGPQILSYVMGSQINGNTSVLNYNFSGVYDKVMCAAFSQVKVHEDGVDVYEAERMKTSERDDDFLPAVVQVASAPSIAIEVPLKPVERHYEEYVSQFKFIPDLSKLDTDTYDTREKYGSYLKSQGMHRFKDTLKIVSSIKCKKLICVGDGIGIAQMVCKKLGLEYYSFDSSQVATEMASEMGNMVHHQSYDQWFSTYRKQIGDVIFFSHVLVFLNDPVPSLIIGKHKIVAFEQLPFAGMTSLSRMCPQAYLFCTKDIGKGSLLSLSSLNPLQYAFYNTFSDKLARHAFEITDHRLISLLEDLNFRGIKARVKNGSIISDAAFFELCSSLQHELVEDPLMKLTYGPSTRKFGPQDRILDILVGEDHSKIAYRSRVIDSPFDSYQRFSLTEEGSIVFANSSYMLHHNKKYIFPPGTRFKKKPLMLWDMPNEVVAVFGEGGYIVYLPSGMNAHLTVIRRD